MDPGAIESQGKRIERTLARLEASLSLEGIKEAYDRDDLADFLIRRPNGGEAHILHLPVLTDPERVYTDIITPLMSRSGAVNEVLPPANHVTSRAMADQQLLYGGVLIFDAGTVHSILIAHAPKRQVAEPSTERAVFGPKDALVEGIDENIALIRNHLRDPRLQVQRLLIGQEAKTTVVLLHVSGMADAGQVDLAMRRLRDFHPQRVGFVSQLLRPLYGAVGSAFLPADFTERPYRIADYLSRGRIAILSDGSPFALVTPIVFWDFFLDEEEYLQAATTRLFVRFLRGVAFFTAMMAPGLYLAILSVNTAILPGLLAIAVSSNRQALPFPIVIETFVMLVVLDIMAEATVSMKGVLGPAISIVGSLIIGQAAVRANLTSNLNVILLALTALATFITPRYQITYAVRFWKYPVMLVSGVFGILGWTAALIGILAFHTTARTLGVPELAPLAPLQPQAFVGQSHSRVPTRKAEPATVERSGPESTT